MRSSLVAVSLAIVVNACMNPGPGPGPGPGPANAPDLIVKSVELGKLAPLPGGAQYVLPMQITLRNRGQAFIKPNQSFDVTAFLRHPDQPNPDPTKPPIPVPDSTPGAGLVFDRPTTMLVQLSGPPPKHFTVNGPINGKTDVSVSRTAYITPLERGEYELVVVVDWCPSWPNSTCQIHEQLENNNAWVGQLSLP